MLVATAWVRPHNSAQAADAAGYRILEAANALAPDDAVMSLLVLTNAPISGEPLPEGSIWPPGGSVWLGRDQLGALLDAAPGVRRRVPAVLGVRDLESLLDAAAGERSSWDEGAARELAPRFVTTRAYSHALDTLERHRFAVLTGPPEMGKTAIARTIGLALATEGWQVHECIRPDQVWSAFDADVPQLFVADDAFGSTEYRPDAADRWALELDAILRRLDDRHWLIWTSRPAPLKAGLGRIHREHGIERFPHPAEVHVDASALDVEEKALILFRHARAAALRPTAVQIVRDHGLLVVEHPMFTPGRIGRFVEVRLPVLAAKPRGADLHGPLRDAIDAEIAEPTDAMAASLRALPPEHRALLVALVDQPPGPVAERELTAAARRHASEGLPKSPADIVDRLTDHFVRVIPPSTVTWVHPSWRDLVIDDLAADPAARARFVRHCSVDGLLLALSHGGGATGRRALPLLVADADWDAAAERIHELVPELDEADVTRLLDGLDAAHGQAGDRESNELVALTGTALARLSACWRDGRSLPGGRLLGRCIDLSSLLPDRPPGFELERIWEHAIPAAATPYSLREAEQYLRWLRLALALIREPETLERLGFPTAYGAQIEALLSVHDGEPAVQESGSLRATLSESLILVAALVPERFAAAEYRRAALRRLDTLASAWPGPEPAAWTPSPAPAAPAIVGRILADLG